MARGGGPGGYGGACAERGARPETPQLACASDVDRLVARCMTHERPAALVQASAGLLDAASALLGEEALLGEKRSDKIRRMLRLTDELRRYNAGLTKQVLPPLPETERLAPGEG